MFLPLLKILAMFALNLHTKLNNTQLLCTYANKSSYHKMNFEHKQKDQPSMLTHHTSHYSYLNVCIIHSQDNKRSLLNNVPRVPKCLSVLIAQVLKCQSALSDRVPECLMCPKARVPFKFPNESNTSVSIHTLQDKLILFKSV